MCARIATNRPGDKWRFAATSYAHGGGLRLEVRRKRSITVRSEQSARCTVTRLLCHCAALRECGWKVSVSAIVFLYLLSTASRRSPRRSISQCPLRRRPRLHVTLRPSQPCAFLRALHFRALSCAFVHALCTHDILTEIVGTVVTHVRTASVRERERLPTSE